MLTPDDARRLLEHGYEVHLTAAIAGGALDPKRIMSDEQAKRWLEQQVKGVPKRRRPLMYRTVAQLDSITSLLSNWFPQVFTRVSSLKRRCRGGPVYALRMRAGSGAGRRGVLIVGGTHARELMNPDAIIELAIDMLLSYLNGTNISYGGKTFRPSMSS